MGYHFLGYSDGCLIELISWAGKNMASWADLWICLEMGEGGVESERCGLKFQESRTGMGYRKEAKETEQ